MKLYINRKRLDWLSDAPRVQYETPVDDKGGDYEIHLYFSEILYPEAMAAGARVFDILVEGSIAVENLQSLRV